MISAVSTNEEGELAEKLRGIELKNDDVLQELKGLDTSKVTLSYPRPLTRDNSLLIKGPKNVDGIVIKMVMNKNWETELLDAVKKSI